MAKHNETGKKGEAIAIEFLTNKGYAILNTNWIFEKKELDIVAEKDDFLVIVEVKTRTSDYFELPKQAVSASKIRNIVSATHEYILQYDIKKEVRFDIISIVLYPKHHTLEHIEDAFFPPVS